MTRMQVLQEAKRFLHGRKIGSEVLESDQAWLKSAELIVMFGASDDLVEIRGWVYDEIGVYGSREIVFINGELYSSKCESEECPHEAERKKKGVKVNALWGHGGVSWSFETSIPHETFDVIEDGEVFCRGIVFCRESAFHQ